MTDRKKTKFTAPVIIDSQTHKGVKPLLKTVHTLASQPNTVWANAEAERLDSYFTAMSRYLTHAVTNAADHYRDDEAFNSILSADGLKELYNDMATKSKNSLLSEVAILPDNLLRSGPASYLFSSQPSFNVGFSYNSRAFDFGFLRVYQNNHQSSTTFPIFTVDHNMINALDKKVVKPILKDLQSVMTYVNHDVLHHFNMPVISSSVVHPYDPIFSMNNTLKWEAEYKGLGNYYEEWSHIAHEKILQEDDLDHLKELSQTVDHYFDQLSMLSPDAIRMDNGYSPDFSGDLMAQAQDKGEKWFNEQLCHCAHYEVVDFYGTMMLHVLSRTFSFDHPVMIQAIDRMAEIDPNPELAFDTCANMMLIDQKSGREHTLNSIRKHVLEQSIEEVMPSDILKEYRKVGFDMFPDKNENVEYKHLKMLQLISISYDDVFAHVPSNEICYIGQLRRNADDVLLSMVKATAKDSGTMAKKRAQFDQSDKGKRGALNKVLKKIHLQRWG